MTPLTPMIALTSVLLENERDPEAQESLEIIERNTRYMQDIVSKTIRLEQLNSPSTGLNIESTNLLEITNNIIENNQFLFKQKNLIIDTKIEENFFVQADQNQLKELLDNLLSNAIKFTPECGRITISATKKEDSAIISIRDTGIGLTDEQVKRIFESFYKADSSRHEFGSSGLGLPICKLIVEKHNGAIWAESRGISKGSTFFVKLPMKENKNY